MCGYVCGYVCGFLCGFVCGYVSAIGIMVCQIVASTARIYVLSLVIGVVVDGKMLVGVSAVVAGGSVMSLCRLQQMRVGVDVEVQRRKLNRHRRSASVNYIVPCPHRAFPSSYLPSTNLLTNLLTEVGPHLSTIIKMGSDTTCSL